MKFKQILAIALAMLLLSSCGADIQENHVSDQEVTVATTAAEIPEEVTTLPETRDEVTEADAAPKEEVAEADATPEEEVTEADATPEEEITEADATPEEEVTEADATPEEEVTEEAPDEEIADEEIPEEDETQEALSLIGTTTEGDEFDIDPDYAYFLVNRDIPLPDDYSIETDYIQGSYNLEVTAAYYCRLMIEAAAEDGINLKVLSAYRTINYQQKLFDRNVKSRMDSGMTYDEAYADVLINIALPGTSEHNAGLAVDIITTKDWDTYEGFEDTEEFAWLQEHAHEYGFILRYLKGKEDITGYIYEPWHYRFIGVKYALDIKESGLCLEEYFELHPEAY